MSTAYPPDDITVGSGVWGTDIDREEVYTLTGKYGIVFRATEPAADPYVYTEKMQPTKPGDAWSVEAVVQSGSVAANHTVRLTVAWYTSAEVYISESDIFASSVLPSANVWYTLSGSVTAPANAAFARAVFYKNNLAFGVYLDSIGLSVVEPAFWARLNADQSISTDTPTTLVCDTELYDHGDNYSTSTGIFTVPSDGIYSFSATCEWESALGDGKRHYIQIVVNGDSGPWVGTQDHYTGSASEIPIDTASVAALYLYAGDTVKVRVYQHSGGTVDVNLGLKTGFFGAKLR